MAANSFDEWFAPLIDYVLCKPCPTCKARAWHDCDAPMKRSKANPVHRQHVRRQDRGAAHYYRDVGKAPWMDERTPGTKYHSIDYSSRQANERSTTS